MQKIKVAIIGAGNISNTRHIPALKKLNNVEIVGVVGVRNRNIERTVKKYKILHSLLIKDGLIYEAMKNSDWLKEVDAVVIGAPPRDHYPMAEASLRLNKHVLVEKPMTMNEAEADKLIALAKQSNKQLCVMQNFQYTSGMRKLEDIISRGGLGAISSYYEFQFTNRRRRLPEWYYDLPLGLFYDEAPHFMYLLEKFGGPLKIDNAFAQYGAEKNDNTPKLLNVSLKAGEFHFAADILKNSLRTTSQYWAGFIKNGFKMVGGNLLYGHEVVMRKFIDAIAEGRNVDADISGEAGKRTVAYMQAIVDNVNHKGGSNR
jgi:scyllo-inositol 2-dehydrogenase (NADP+)